MKNKEKIEKRNIKAKKLPGVFKKSYTEEKLNKKILKHVYIPSDNTFLSSYFAKGNNPKKTDLLAIDRNAVFTKKELKRFKRLSKEIKSHKGRFNWGAIAAVFSFIAVLFIGGFLFKDTLIKIGIKKSCESIFNAKTEVNSVKLDLIKSSLTISKITVGDSNQEFKNLFEAGNIIVDVNIPQAFRKRFVAENLTCSDLKFNTDRKNSCKLPEKKKKDSDVKDKSFKTENVAKSDNSELITQKKQEAANLIKSNITAVLGSSDPEEIINSILQNFKSPAAIEGAVSTTNNLINKWEPKPVEVTNKVTDFYNSSMDLLKIDVSKVPDIPTFTKDIEIITAAINKGNELKKEIDVISKEIEPDFNQIKNTTETISSALKDDRDFASNTLNSVKGLSKSASSIFEKGLDSLGYEVLGKYYPYAKKGSALLEKLQKNKRKEATPKKVKKNQKRLEGTTFYYGAEYPEFLIQKIYASGEKFNVLIEECTNNQDIRNKPMSVLLNLETNEVQHCANIVVDARSSLNRPATVNISYDGKGFNTKIDGTSIAVKKGVPSLNGKTNIHLDGIASVQSFTAGGKVVIPQVNLTSDGFDNELITKYYLQALHSVDKLNFEYKIKIDDMGPDLRISGNFADQFVNALSKVANQIGNDAKKEAFSAINKQLNSYENEYLAKAKEFAGIKDDIDVQKIRLDNIQKELQNKINEIQNKITEYTNEAKRQAEEAAKKAAKQAADAAAQKAQETAEQAAQQLTNQATDAAKNLLKGFGR